MWTTMNLLISKVGWNNPLGSNISCKSTSCIHCRQVMRSYHHWQKNSIYIKLISVGVTTFSSGRNPRNYWRLLRGCCQNVKRSGCLAYGVAGVHTRISWDIIMYKWWVKCHSMQCKWWDYGRLCKAFRHLDPPFRAMTNSCKTERTSKSIISNQWQSRWWHLAVLIWQRFTTAVIFKSNCESYLFLSNDPDYQGSHSSFVGQW